MVNFIKEWWELFIWAWICIWEEFTGQEVSCPPCWKCDLARLIMLCVVVVFLYLTITLGYEHATNWR